MKVLLEHRVNPIPECMPHEVLLVRTEYSDSCPWKHADAVIVGCRTEKGLVIYKNRCISKYQEKEGPTQVRQLHELAQVDSVQDCVRVGERLAKALAREMPHCAKVRNRKRTAGILTHAIWHLWQEVLHPEPDKDHEEDENYRWVPLFGEEGHETPDR